MTQIVATGLGRSYLSGPSRVWAVRDVTFQVSSGEFACVFGASGSGKSTLLSLLSGLLRSDTGEAFIAGLNVTTLDEDGRTKLRRENLGIVFQGDNLIDEFTAIENVQLPIEASGRSGPQVTDMARRSLARVGIEELSDRLPSQLSGGQRQRVGIARALVGDRQVILADEPTGALDSANSTALFTLLRDLAGEGVTVLLATHEAGARDFCDSVYVMTDGRLELESTRLAAVPSE